MDSKLIFNETRGHGFTISLSGIAVAVSRVFSFAAPELEIGDFFSVTSRMQSPWLIVRERIDQFYVSVTGLIGENLRKAVRATVHFASRVFNFRRQQVLRLSFAGRRL